MKEPHLFHLDRNQNLKKHLKNPVFEVYQYVLIHRIEVDEESLIYISIVYRQEYLVNIRIHHAKIKGENKRMKSFPSIFILYFDIKFFRSNTIKPTPA